MSEKNKQYKNCTVCGKGYYVAKYRSDASKFCSKSCWRKRRILNTCLMCGSEISSYHAKKYCGKDCAVKAMIGNNAPAWKDGKSLERDRARLSQQLVFWRKQVFARDKYTCQHCGNKKTLQAHHILEWAKDESRRFDVDNGLTLCVECHGKVHGKDFRKRHSKKCSDCGKQVKKSSTICRSCSSKQQWKKRKILRSDR